MGEPGADDRNLDEQVCWKDFFFAYFFPNCGPTDQSITCGTRSGTPSGTWSPRPRSPELQCVCGATLRNEELCVHALECKKVKGKTQAYRHKEVKEAFRNLLIYIRIQGCITDSKLMYLVGTFSFKGGGFVYY